MQHSPFISNSREIIHSKCNSRLSVPRVCEQVKLLSLMLLFFLTVIKKKECLSGHHLSPLLVWTHLPALCQKSRVTLGATPWGLWLPRTAELASHPPAQLGDIIIDFISNFFLYTFFFSFTSEHTAELTEQFLFLKLFRPLETSELNEELKFFLEINFIFHLP